MSSDTRIRVVLALFDQHHDSVLRFARRSVDAATADDIAQEVFARLLRLPDLEHKDIRAGYLIKIAENLIRRRHRHTRRFAETAPSLAYNSARVAGRHESDGRRAHEDDERRTRASRAVSSLVDHERQAVELVVSRGLSYRQAAESMGVKVSDVNNWRHRGVEKLRRLAAGEAEGGVG